MHINKPKFIDTLKELEDSFSGYSLPYWEDLPDIELYMDQVISLIKKYLEILYKVTISEKFITPSMINNYVKLKIIPPPVKKKYSKLHLAHLLVVCTLKQTLDMVTIQTILPPDLNEEEVKIAYNSFVKNQHKAFLYVIDNINSVSTPILNAEEENQTRMNDLLMQISASANICKIITENITRLAGTPQEFEIK